MYKNNIRWDPNRLFAIMEKTGTTVREISDGCGISVPALNTYKRDSSKIPSAESIAKLSLFFGISSDYFLGLMNPEQEKELLGNAYQFFSDHKLLTFEKVCRGKYLSGNNTTVRGSEAPWPYNLICGIFSYSHKYDEDEYIKNNMLPVRVPLSQDQIKGLEYTLDLIGERQKNMLLLYYKKSKTFDEIGEMYGVTRERARQILARALRLIRCRTNADYIRYGYRGCGLLQRERKLDEKEADLRRREKELEKLERRLSGKIEVVKDTPEYKNLRMMEIEIESLELSVRAYNCLHRAEVSTIEAVLRLIENDSLYTLRNLGSRSLFEIISKLEEIGVTFELGKKTKKAYENAMDYVQKVG